MRTFVIKNESFSVDKHWPDAPPIERVDRFSFYDRAREAFAVVITGETAKYGNIIRKKGVTTP